MKYFFSLLLYRSFLLVLSPLIVIFFLWRSRKNKAFRHRLTERFAIQPKSLKAGGIVVHAASVGEVIALKPFIDKLLLAYPKLPITLTTFTPTGSAQVIKLFGDKVQHCYLPLDIYPCTWLFLQKLKPQAMIFMETELWPNLIAQAANRNIKLLLINARLSSHSMKSYQKLKWLIQPCLNHFNKILPQSQDNLQNFIKLGADDSRCHCLGNLKFDISNNSKIDAKKAELAALLPNNRKLWLVASTHQGDEILALAVFKKLQQAHPELLLVLVPRHPERFTAVAELCRTQRVNVVQRSTKLPVTDSTQVWLLDSLGELMAAYALADVVTLGGSFSEINGHNPLEPALFKKPIITGPYMGNFTEINQLLKAVQGIVQLTSTDEEELTQAMQFLLVDENKQHQLGNNAYQVVIENQGASQGSIEQLQALLPTEEQVITINNNDVFCRYDGNLFSKLNSEFSPEMLSSSYWQHQQAITGSAQGRGTTWFVQHQKSHWVLRHYYRGGLIGKFNKDHYIFTSQAATRAAKEFNLLSLMQTWNLPAPKPVAYRVVRNGLFYRADLLSSRVENAQDLVAILTEQPISADVWFDIGQTIKKFHHKGVYHHDLNIHNILLDSDNKSWLIDFDQGEQRQIQQSWQQANMHRLLRSFRKEQNKLTSFFWSEENWRMLLEGYEH
ncbi:MAG: lipid IV(A) 3-deoxy-D-manno-octulosonic acid transferase [Colwellia sp.]|nr:lipid IV(A) 3-deoxy-D-manno-octulosonic acid transferase [Colwellia sp.]